MRQRTKGRLKVAAGSLLLLSCALQAQQTVPSPMVEQARYWEQKGRYDLARDAWLKQLNNNPDDAESLAGIALAEARSGRTAAAQVYLDRLRDRQAEHPRIRDIEEAIRSGAYDSERMATPRELARNGRFDAAVAAYREIYGSEIPGGRLGLEYYQTLAGATDGWAPARAGIEGLAQQHSDEPIYALALAQHLSYREETRRDGIQRLARLTEVNSVASQARQAWRQALLWLGTEARDEPYYQSYIAKFGADTEIDQRIAAIREGRRVAALPAAPTPEQLRGAAVRSAYALLDQGKVEAAEAEFQNLAGASTPDPDAVAGLGILRLQQQRYAESRELLERASRLAPQRASRWKEALSSARFWEKVRGAQSAREAGQGAEAERLLRSAISADPALAQREPSVKLTLADLLAERGQTQQAETLYREVLKREPGQADATRGLIGLLAADKRLPEALALADRLSAEQQAAVGGLGSLRATALRSQAETAVKAKDDARAETLLREALLLDPESPWTRMDLARLYQRNQRTREASTLIDGLLEGGNRMPETIFVKAMLLGEQQNWLEGLQMLEQIPQGSRTPGMADLQRRLWVRYQTQRSAVYARNGRQQEAMQILKDAESEAGTSSELLGALAFGYADAGDDANAMDYMRRALARSPKPDPGLRLAYAGLLFKLRQDTEFEVVMEDLVKNQAKLANDQILQLEDLRIAYRLRQADLLREQKKLAQAYDALEPLLKTTPNEPRLLMALARLYSDAKEFEPALQLNRRVIEADPQNVDAYKGAIGAALALNQLDEAESLLNHAVRLDAENPRLYALAGRIARARGQDGRALELYKEALRLDQEQGSAEFGTEGYSPQLYLLSPAQPTTVPRPLGTAPKALPFKTSLQPAKPMRRELREDRALVAMPRWWKANNTAQHRGHARLIKVAATPEQQTTTSQQYPRPRTPTQTAPQNADTSLPGYRSGGVWVQDGPDSYTYTTDPRSVVISTPAPAPQTVRSLPDLPMPANAQQTRPQLAPSTTLSAPRAARDPGLREDVLKDIDDLQPAAPARLAPRAPAIYTAPSARPAPVVRTAPLKLRQDPLLERPDFAQTRRKTNTAKPNELLQEIAEINAKRSPYAGFGFAMRTRDGAEGLDKLYDLEAPIELSMSAALAGRLKLRAVPVSLDAGTVAGQQLPLFGAMNLALAAGVAAESASFQQDASGVAVGAAYEVGNLKLDLGSTPLGFQLETLVGGVSWSPKAGRTSYKIDLSRRSMTDSLLSYGGAHDPATGKDWGGVTKNGGRLDIAYDMGPYGVYGAGSYHVLDGENVARNNVFEFGGGIYARALDRRTQRVTYGLNLTAFFYDKNLRRFSLGQGGYFSPQSYLSVAVPVEWTGHRDRMSWRLGGALGVQAFREDSQVYYPNDSLLQAQLVALAADDEDLEVDYPSQSSTGIGFNFGGELEYLLAPNLALGAHAGIDNARDYNETGFFGYVRYMFDPQSRLGDAPMPIVPNYAWGH